MTLDFEPRADRPEEVGYKHERRSARANGGESHSF